MALVHDEVVISERGGGWPRRVPVTNVQCSWEVSAPGTFSAFVRIADLRHANLSHDLTGSWVSYDSPVGRWAGVITGRPIADGVAELMAEGWASLLRGRIVIDGVAAVPGGPGGLARRAVIEAARQETTYITVGTIDEGGEYLETEVGVGDAADAILAQLATAIEWIVDEQRVFHAMRRLGADRSATVRLVEDRHIVAYRLDDDIWSAPLGQVFVTEFDSVFSDAQASAGMLPMSALPPGMAPSPFTPVAVLNPSMQPSGVGAYLNDGPHLGPGLLQMVQSDDPIAGRYRKTNRRAWGDEGRTPPAPAQWTSFAAGVSANNPAVPSTRHAPPPTIPVELTLSNADDCQRRFGLADTVRIDIGSIGFSGRFRTMVRAMDVAKGEMTVAGEALPD